MKVFPSYSHLSNQQLRDEVNRVARSEREATAHLVALLAEFDQRRLYLEDGYDSLFQYCVEKLLLSESAAYARIQAARAARHWPRILTLLFDGSLTLTNVGLLAPHLTADNCASLLAEARRRRKSYVEQMIARINPQPDAPSVVRKLPIRQSPTAAPRDGAASAAPTSAPAAVQIVQAGAAVSLFEPPVANAPPKAAVPPMKPAVVAPIAPERYRIQITVDQETRDALKQAQDLMRHSLPSGDPALIISRALKLLVADLLRTKAAATRRPGKPRELAEGSRTIPAAVMRAVWTRDGGRCAYEGPRGRCSNEGFVEYHHVIPYALGGVATADNIELRCRAHNAHEARLAGLPLGPGAVERAEM